MRYPHRTYCDTLEEMRKLTENMSLLNYYRALPTLKLLIEECQTYGNRMESALEYKGDLNQLHKQRKKLLAQVDTLKVALGKKDKGRLNLRDELGLDDED